MLESFHGKLSIFSYFVVSFHTLELLGTSRRHHLLWLLCKSIPDNFHSPSWSINDSIWIHSSQVSRTASVLLPMLSSSNLCASHRSCHIPEYCMSIKIDSNRAIFYYFWSGVHLESHCYIALDSVPWYRQENMPRNRAEVTQNVSEACSMALQEYLWRK